MHVNIYEILFYTYLKSSKKKDDTLMIGAAKDNQSLITSQYNRKR